MDYPVTYGTLCETHGKTGYKTRQRALDALTYLQERAPTDTVPNRTYRDPVCHMWHLTSKGR
jgi:hypothetical protein